MDKEMAAEVFDTSMKNTKGFKMETPEGNEVEGYICKNRKFNMGSLIINKVNGIETGQYVQGMPKIGYLDRYTPLIENPKVFRKADGSNMVMYPLIVDGECIEVLFKTRNTPRVDKKLMKRTLLAVNDAHYKAVERERKSFTYEVYGYENPHEVNYKFLDIPIKMDLLAVLEQGKSLPVSKMYDIANKYGIEVVGQDLVIAEPDITGGTYDAHISASCENLYGDFLPKEMLSAPTIEDLYQDMQTFYEKINMAYQESEKIGGIIAEGSVWHFGYPENFMLKNKATSVREGHIKQACGIPHHDIRKAMLKAEDDGVNLEDLEATYTYIIGELSEEYPPLMIMEKKTRDKISAIVVRYTRKVELDASLESMAQAVIDKVGKEADPADKMREFSNMFPDYKRLSSKMYQAFTQM
jgi:hypothetical protein